MQAQENAAKDVEHNILSKWIGLSVLHSTSVQMSCVTVSTVFCSWISWPRLRIEDWISEESTKKNHTNV